MNLLLTAVGGAGDDRKCVVNWDQARYATPSTGVDEHVTVVYFSDDIADFISVRETPEQIFEMLKEEK